MKKLRQRLKAFAGQHAPKVFLLTIGVAVGALSFGGNGSNTADSGSAHEHVEHACDSTNKAAWTCSMHPQIQQPDPGQCPICGMDLIPVNADHGEEEASANQLVLSKRAQALARLRTVPVSHHVAGEQSPNQTRLLGRIEPNETTLRTVTAWTGGRIDRLHVRTTGERIRAGQVIATLYSPEIFTAHQDLIVAKRQVTRMSSAIESAKAAAREALSAARERLRLLGISASELDRMQDSSSPLREVPIRSPFSGTVMERIATEGGYVSTGAPLYKVANLSTLWVQLDAYEGDLSQLKVGQGVRIDVAALAPQTFDGKVTFIEPTLDPTTRTTRVRVEVQNPQGELKPGMFAQAIVSSGAVSHTALAVPASAVLFTGRRSVVYAEVLLDSGQVAYEPRSVRLGPRTGNTYPVVAGLSAGERIVTRGAFALDADLQIRGGPSMMSLHDDRAEGEWDEVVPIHAATRAKIAPIVTHYLALQEALAGDDLVAAKKATTQLTGAAKPLKLPEPAAAAVWERLKADVLIHGKHVVSSDSLEHARTGFEGLSQAMTGLVRQLGNPLDRDLFVAHCPMAAGSNGASWIQDKKQLRNSYFGEAMLTCGEVKARVGAGAYLATPQAAENTGSAPAGGHRH